MRSRLPRLRLAALACLLPLSLFGADPRLQELLKLYPEADTNRDGVLSLEEAQAHAKVIRKGKGGKAGGDSTSAEDTGAARNSASKPKPTYANVSYGPDVRNKLDLWLAKSDKPTALVVYIHGGGFVNGSKDGASAEMIEGCLAAGVSYMSINYRYRTTAPIQDILRDCARSIQYVRSKAKEYNIDPKRIASYGGSAGAGTSLWLAFHDDLADLKNADPVLRESSRIAAAGAINTQGTYNLTRWAEILRKPEGEFTRPGESAAFYGAKNDDELETAKYQAILRDTDMLALVSKDDPPVFLYTSHPDGAIANRGALLHHPDHPRAVKKRCDEVGVPAILYFATTEPRLTGNYQAKLREFLLAHLK